ncbi:MAG: hypothetical protein Q7U75_11820, partial [Desulfobacterales bacterium]|nr:hypothetical protein [Desulfobacterales bacterium]
YLLPTKAELGHESATGHFRSLPEVETERTLDTHPAVVWWVKNGDRGADYFSIPYIDDSKGTDCLELANFYPDYVALLRDAAGHQVVAVVEAKREDEMNHNPRQTECKAKWLQRYLRMANERAERDLTEPASYVGGIVRVVPPGHRHTGTTINTHPDWAYDEKHMFSLEGFLTDSAK